MKTKVQKWGNSLGLRIPKAFAKEAAVEAGSTVELSLDSAGQLIVRPLRPRTYDLDELLAGVTENNLHDELWTDQPRGREAW